MNWHSSNQQFFKSSALPQKNKTSNCPTAQPSGFFHFAMAATAAAGRLKRGSGALKKGKRFDLAEKHTKKQVCIGVMFFHEKKVCIILVEGYFMDV